MRLRVVTWNVHSWIGTDRREDVARIARVLEGLDADVIGLQEVDSRAAHPTQPDPLERIAAQLGMTALAGPNLADDRGEYGNGLLTRLPVATFDRVDLSEIGREPRGAIDATLEHGSAPVRVIVTHFGLDRAERRAQAHRLAARLQDSPEPGGVRVLLGDLNEWRPWVRPDRRLIPDQFDHGFSARSFPARLPILRLDRIFVSPRPDASRLHVEGGALARRASDHLPLILDAEWSST